MEFVHALVVLALAPLLYFGTGLACAQWTCCVAWAPLWGAGLLGFTAELAYIFGVPVTPAIMGVGLVLLIFAGWDLVRGPGSLRENWAGVAGEFAEFGKVYLMALLPFVAAPFATPGLWSGDWFLALDSAQHLWQGIPFTTDLLARPPLFGAASIPMLWLGPPMVSFQIFCAVASACALQVVRTGLKPGASLHLVWVLAGSLFFLQVSANAWPKFLSAAFLLAAWQALEMSGHRRLLVTSAFYGLALATHQSAVLFAPLLLVRFFARPESGRVRLGQLVLVTAVVTLVAAPWEIYTVVTYGWTAKIHANPAVSQRIAAVPAWLNAALVGLGIFAAWGPFYVIWHWISAPDRFTAFRFEHEIYWLITSTFNSLAASLLGLILPWWAALGWRELPRRLRGFWNQLDGPVRGALAVALAGQILLDPFYSTDGSLHTGWVPVGVALVLWFANDLADAPRSELRAVLQRTVWLGAAPWVVFNVALTAALVLSWRFRQLFFDSDLQLLDDHGWVTLAMGGFPWIQILAAAIAWYAFTRSRNPRPSHEG